MKKKKWNKLLAVLLVMVTAYHFCQAVAENCGKRRCRNNHSVFMEHKPV